MDVKIKTIDAAGVYFILLILFVLAYYCNGGTLRHLQK
jgi:hypothetical protein